MKHYKEKFKNWIVKMTNGPYAVWTLGGMSFLESIISPIPADIFLMPLSTLRPKKWIWFAFVTTITSVLGALMGYIIGSALFDVIGRPLVEFYSLQDQMVRVGELFDKNTFSAIFIGAFTPIPFKVFTLAGGFFKIKILPFIIASFVGRGLRYFMVSWLMQRFGENVARIVYRYLSLFMLLSAAIILIVILFV